MPAAMSGAARLHLTTHPGLEDIVIAEFRERAAAVGVPAEAVRAEPAGFRGRVEVEASLAEGELLALGRAMRSVHHVLRPVLRLELEPGRELSMLDAALRAAEIPALGPKTSFRITATRHGSHDFTSMDLARVAGAAVQARTGAPVDLEHFHVEIRVDLVERDLAVAVQLTREPLSRRFLKPYEQRVSLKADMAYAMLRLAGHPGAGAKLLDPFCGTGTILLEAGAVWPDVVRVGSDVDPRAVEGALRNLAANRLEAGARIVRADARRLAEELGEGGFSRIMTNPPFGRAMGRRIHFFEFYLRMLASARRVLLPHGRMVVLAQRRDAFRAAVEHHGHFRIVHARVVDMSRLFVGLFVLAPRG